VTSWHQPRTAAALVAAVLVLAVGCGGGSSDAQGTSSSGNGAASTAVLRPDSGPFGEMLVDRRGRTIYVFAKDDPGSSSCDGTCATNWPPVMAPEPVPSSLPGVSATVGATTRDDGSTQLTVADHPVYRFSGDTEPGQANGQGLTLDGGLWTVISPAGSPVSGSGTGTTPSEPTGGYGY
jgi:predicted lipoprotein with Yx(FWY)xxD motif